MIPAYNEAGRIQPTLERILAYFNHWARPDLYEILVIDDGSTDNTAAIVNALRMSSPNIRLLALERNRGKGYAVREGVLAARGQYIFFSDADLSTPIEEIDNLLGELEKGADGVIGSRALPDSRLEVRQAILRETMGKTFNKLVQLILSLPYSDTQCGFKGFRYDIARELFKHQTLDGFAFDVEILYLGRQMNFDIREIPVRWRNEGNSKVSVVKDSLKMLRDLIIIRWRHRFLRVNKGGHSPR